MSGFIVYSIAGSPFGRAVLATLEEKAAAYKLSLVAPGAFRPTEHLARHPFGRVPVLSMTASCSTRLRRSCAIWTAPCRPPR